MPNPLNAIYAAQREQQLKDRSRKPPARPTAGPTRGSQRSRVIASLIALPGTDRASARS